jgi:hypothetical protein
MDRRFAVVCPLLCEVGAMLLGWLCAVRFQPLFYVRLTTVAPVCTFRTLDWLWHERLPKLTQLVHISFRLQENKSRIDELQRLDSDQLHENGMMPNHPLDGQFFANSTSKTALAYSFSVLDASFCLLYCHHPVKI